MAWQAAFGLNQAARQSRARSCICRGVIDGLLSPLACAELRFILGALGVRGNRQSVRDA